MPRNNKKGKKGKGNGMPFNTGIPTRKQTNALIKRYIRGSYQPTLRELNSQYKGSEQRQTKEIPAWFDSYRQMIDAERGNTNKSYQQGQDRIGNFSQTSEAADGARRAQVADILAKDKALRGANTDIAGADAEAAGASGNRIAIGGNMMGLLANRAQIQDSYMGRRKAITMDQQDRALQAEKVRQSKIAADRRDTRDKMRGDITKFLLDQRSANNQFYLDNASLATKKDYNNALRYQAYQGAHKNVNVNNTYSGTGGGGKGKGGGNGNSGRDAWGIALANLETKYPYGDGGNISNKARRTMYRYLVTPQGGSFSPNAAKKAIARYESIAARKAREQRRR